MKIRNAGKAVAFAGGILLSAFSQANAETTSNDLIFAKPEIIQEKVCSFLPINGKGLATLAYVVGEKQSVLDVPVEVGDVVYLFGLFAAIAKKESNDLVIPVNQKGATPVPLPSSFRAQLVEKANDLRQNCPILKQ